MLFIFDTKRKKKFQKQSRLIIIGDYFLSKFRRAILRFHLNSQNDLKYQPSVNVNKPSIN